MAEKKDKETKSSNEKTYLVRYRLKGEKGRTPRKVTVQALNQSDAKKTAIATIPGAEIVGGAKELDEGVLDFADRVAKFASRCAGRLCHAYSKSPVRDTGSISTTGKIFSRELAHLAGNKLMSAGGGTTQRMGKMKISSVTGGAKKSARRSRSTKQKRK
jgi:hypothetical protein